MNKLVVRFLNVSYYLLHFYSIRTGGEARTPDTRFWRPVLYQLSYSRLNKSVPEMNRELTAIID